jgi:hypothetical protein
MPFVPVPNTVKVSIIGHIENQEVVNILHFTLSTAPTVTNITNLLADVKAFWEAQMLPLISNHYLVDRYDAVDLTTSTGITRQLINTPPVAGSQTGTPIPNSNALVMTKRTALRGRSYRGRTYVGGLTVGDLAGTSDVGTTILSNFIAAFAGLLTSSSFHTFVFSVVSYFLNGVARSVGHSEPVTAISGDTSVDSQRRRLTGRGA